MMLWKCYTLCTSKFGKLNSGHRTGKGQFSFQSQRKAMPKKFKLLYSCTFSHVSKVMVNILQARLQQYTNQKLPDVQGGFRKTEELSHTLILFCFVWAGITYPIGGINSLAFRKWSNSHICTWLLVKPQIWLSAEELMLLNCSAGEDSWESLGQQGDQTSQP